MNLKEAIFGGGPRSVAGSDSVYRDSIQAWLPVKNIIGGVVVTKDNRFIKILEVLPVNIYLKSPADRQNIISAFASWLKIAPDSLQIEARTLPADTADYVRQMEEYAKAEDNDFCREMIEDNIREIGEGVASEAIRHRFFPDFPVRTAYAGQTEHGQGHCGASQRGGGHGAAVSGRVRAGSAGTAILRQLHAESPL